MYIYISSNLFRNVEVHGVLLIVHLQIASSSKLEIICKCFICILSQSKKILQFFYQFKVFSCLSSTQIGAILVWRAYKMFLEIWVFFPYHHRIKTTRMANKEVAKEEGETKNIVILFSFPFCFYLTYLGISNNFKATHKISIFWLSYRCDTFFHY
jgi:hypothetical protein